MIMDVKKNILDDDGQALIEFFLFLPMVLMIYTVILSVSNALNASINQQKIVRSYLYYKVQNNSTIPMPTRNGPDPSEGWRLFGTEVIGWSIRLNDNNKPVSPCFELNLPFKNAPGDKCEEPYSEPKTQFIRTQTVYGICGATYVKNPETRFNKAYPAGSGPLGNGSDHCIIK